MIKDATEVGEVARSRKTSWVCRWAHLHTPADFAPGNAQRWPLTQGNDVLVASLRTEVGRGSRHVLGTTPSTRTVLPG